MIAHSFVFLGVYISSITYIVFLFIENIRPCILFIGKLNHPINGKNINFSLNKSHINLG
jgi:hypothetical protein